MFEPLENAVKVGDAEEVQKAIFDLGFTHLGREMPDDISFKILEILKEHEMFQSPLAGHLLNHFEFHSSQLSPKAKDRCIGFLRAWGDKFKHVHSSQVVAELREGTYLG